MIDDRGKKPRYSDEERYLIEKLLSEGVSRSAIGRELGRSDQSLFNEVKRHLINGKYSAKHAIDLSKRKYKNSPINEETREKIVDLYNRGYSQFAVSLNCGVSSKTVHKTIMSKGLPLPEKGTWANERRINAMEEKVDALMAHSEIILDALQDLSKKMEEK